MNSPLSHASSCDGAPAPGSVPSGSDPRPVEQQRHNRPPHRPVPVTASQLLAAPACLTECRSAGASWVLSGAEGSPLRVQKLALSGLGGPSLTLVSFSFRKETRGHKAYFLKHHFPARRVCTEAPNPHNATHLPRGILSPAQSPGSLRTAPQQPCPCAGWWPPRGRGCRTGEADRRRRETVALHHPPPFPGVCLLPQRSRRISRHLQGTDTGKPSPRAFLSCCLLNSKTVAVPSYCLWVGP